MSSKRQYIQITHRGTKYVNLKEVALKYNISYSALQRAFSTDKLDITKYLDFLDGYVESIFKQQQIQFRGKEYKDVLDIIRSYRLPKIKAIVLLQQGVDLEEVVFKDINYNAHTSKKLEYNGLNFNTLTDLCNHLEVRYSYLHRVYMKTDDLELSVSKSKLDMERKKKLTKVREIFK